MSINYWQPLEEQCFYHIYNRSINKETIFKSDENYRFFLRRWGKYLSPYVDTYTYALIPNHFHFLARVRPADEAFLASAKKELTKRGQKFVAGEINVSEFLEDQMKRFLGSYAEAFNKQENREGSLLQKRFKRVMIKSEVQLLYMIAYNHHNPIHHKLVKNYEDWKYTSYRAICSNAPTKICRDAVLDLFSEGDAQKAMKLFLEYHKNFKIDKGMEDWMLDHE